jgi:GxxExxY protein
MPIEVQGGPLTVYSQDQFHELDHEVMGIVFGIHNEFGCLLDELLYRREIANRCREAGIPVERELRVRVTHASFTKVYRIDLVLAHGVIYEVKTADRLSPAHETQAMNYMLLTSTLHAKLINMRPHRVERRFVSTRLTIDSRRSLRIDDRAWRDVNPESRQLRELMVDLGRDWGVFLECNLYRDAITHFFGGENVIDRPIPIFSGDRMIGEQDERLIGQDTAFAVTTLTESTWGMRSHLGRFLEHTRLRHLQWINLNHERIEFVTLSR